MDQIKLHAKGLGLAEVQYAPPSINHDGAVLVDGPKDNTDFGSSFGNGLLPHLSGKNVAVIRRIRKVTADGAHCLSFVGTQFPDNGVTCDTEAVLAGKYRPLKPRGESSGCIDVDRVIIIARMHVQQTLYWSRYEL